jgi:hypothetical protein
MGDLKPIGSEKLTGQEKLNRIMEIARFNEVIPEKINETAKNEYSVNLADGVDYQIFKEKQGYIIKKTISESDADYIEPMKNRKYYSSYSQALKRLNLLAGELNRLNENEEGVSLYGEQKKFVLKTPKPAVDELPVPAPAAAPPAVPSPELPPSPIGADMGSEEVGPEGDAEMNVDMDSEEMGPEGDVEMDVDMDVESPESDEETVTFKTIQKLTGKLTQKIRTLDNEKGMTSEDIKYVINMVISSLDLKSLSEEDKEDIVSKFEEDSEDLGGDDMDGEDLTDDSEVEDIQADMDVPVEGEMEEAMYGSFGDMRRKDFKGDKYYDESDTMAKDFEIQGIGGDDFDVEEFDSFQKLYDKYGDKQKWFNKNDGEKMFNLYKDRTGKPFKVKTRKSEMEEEGYGHGAILDHIFGESKVDKVISKYFEVTKKEILENKEKNAKKQIESISQVKRQMKEIVKLTETIEQELASKKFLEENKTAKIVGKTNKKNLVFENKGKQVKISPEGLLV